MHEEIEKWIMEFLSVPNPAFNGLPPCPYAKQVWLNDRVKVIDIGSDVDLYITTMIQDCMQNWPENTDVVMLVTDPELFTGKQLDEMCITASNKDYVLLWDHPDNKEVVDGVVLNQGKYALTFIQPRRELDLARKTLEEQGYYKNFTKEYKEDIIDR